MMICMQNKKTEGQKARKGNTMSDAYSVRGLKTIDAIRKKQGLPTLAEERRENQIKEVMKDFNQSREWACWFLGIEDTKKGD